MLRLQNKIALTLCAIICCSCGFVNLIPIDFNIEPDEKDFILKEEFSSIIIKFDTEMVKKDTENVLQINSDFGLVSADKFWQGNDLYFVPISGWTAGIRYTLVMKGVIRAADGREARIEHYNTFFAINNNSPPLLERYAPQTGASIGTNNVELEFEFSKSMDRYSVESAFTLDGVSDKNYEWLNNDKLFRVILKKSLSPWILYKWNIKSTAKSKDGVPLQISYSDIFTTDLDQTLPAVTRIFPVINTDGKWYPTGLDIETGLGLGEGIAVEFNKNMDDNVLRSLRFEPSLSGRAEFLSENSIVYIFSKSPEPETEYTMTISSDTKDSEGLKLGENIKINFIPDISYLKILDINIDNNFIDTNRNNGNVFKINVDHGTGYINLTVHFSLMFNTEEKKNIPQRITLSPFFPGILAPVAVQYVNWISDDRIFIRWEGLTPSKDEPHYYKLTISGGKNGISAYSGIYMKENFIIYLEAV